MRYYLGRSPSLTLLPSLEGAVSRAASSEPPKITAGVQEHEDLYIHMLDAQLSYGFEFYGCDVSLALTPITERCFLSLTQVMRFVDQRNSCIVNELFVFWFASKMQISDFVVIWGFPEGRNVLVEVGAFCGPRVLTDICSFIKALFCSDHV